MDLSRYATLVFDCDGVILDSNGVKSAAFYTTALPYGESAARRLLEYHVTHGGVSRYRKFEHFLADIIDGPAPDDSLELLLHALAVAVRGGLLQCEVNSALGPLRSATPHARWIVVSGGDQTELREIFDQRMLTPMFDAGIFGSPASKDIILARELEAGSLVMPALFIGDSKYDYEAATRAGLDFVFVSQWTEFADWRSFRPATPFRTVPTLHTLLESQ